MSKRQQGTQGGGERYGGMDSGGPDDSVDKPGVATAAQLARRKIAQARGRSTPRGARAGSPAVGPPQASNPFQQQSFQFQPQQNSFDFSVSGATPAPVFGDQSQQNGSGGGMFGSQTNGAASFGGFGNGQANGTPAPSFGSNASAPPAQSNGFNPSTNFGGFGQPQNTPPTTKTSFNFGQTPNQSQEPPKTNAFGATSSNTFAGVGTQQSQQNGAGFGQTKSQEASQKPSTPAFSFGQPQTNGNKSATANMFGATPATAQTNGGSPAPPMGLFGAQPISATPAKSGESIFSGMNSTSTTLKPNMFSFSAQPSRSPSPLVDEQQNGVQTPKTNPFGNFGAQVKTNGEQSSQSTPSLFSQPTQPSQSNGEQTPKPSNPFGGFNFSAPKQQETEKAAEDRAKSPAKDLFSSVGQQNKSACSFGQEASKPEPTTVKGFSFGDTPAQRPEVASPLKFSSAQQEDTSMLTPGSTPHKATLSPSTNIFSAAALQPSAPATQPTQEQSSTETGTGRSIFDRISHDPHASAIKPTFSFSTPGGSTSARREEPVSSNVGKSLFDRMTPSDPESQTSVPPAAFSFGLPAVATTSQTSTDMVASISATNVPSFLQPTPRQAPQQSLQAAATSTRAVSNSPADRRKLRKLNESFLAHLKTQDPQKDWSVLFHYYIDEAAKVMGKEAASVPAMQARPEPSPAQIMPAPSAPVNKTPMVFASQQPATPVHKASGMQIMAYPPPGTSNQEPKEPAKVSNPFTKLAQTPATAPANRKRSADNMTSSATEQHARPESVHYPKLPETASKTAQLFASTLDKQQPLSDNSIGFGGFGTSLESAKASAGTSSPFKPATTFDFGAAATPSAKDVNATAATAATPKTSFKPAINPADTSKAPSFGFKPTTSDATASAASAPSFGFKPAQPTNGPPAETPKAPSFGFKPSANPPPAGGFLAAFGKKADDGEKAAQKRRMDEDYDSDEEDKAAWVAKDKAQQEAKRRKIEEAAKAASGFKIASAGGHSPSIAGDSAPFTSKPSDAEKAAMSTDTPADSNVGKSLFDRITSAEKAPEFSPAPSLFSASTSNPAGASNLFSPSTKAITSSLFAPKAGLSSGFKFGAPVPGNQADKVPAEKDQGSGDKAWTPNTPIKFGGAPATTQSTTPAAPPPMFSGLFGASKTSAQKDDGEAGKLAPPAVGFTFGAPKGVSADVSRATTPGVTTDGESSVAAENGTGDATDAEPSEQQNDQQVEDMAALTPQERADEDVLFEASMAKAQKMDQNKDDGGPGWVERGKGPLYILKNKSTGKVRVVLKISPLGRLAMNFSPVAGMQYSCPPGRKMVQATFFDHIEVSKEKERGSLRPSSWSIQVREAGDAQEIARILTEAAGK
ncbi:hypothetical protein LTR62_006425 [Meristemomyces frigidus]|uniref:RanBD1 domain-containing protein n=1 Tax=Meristemomyces frigidus TaxID=1508187 RepID=A0AAN7TBR3_9PEZI|nr:hypothetical protein LTR62_006425 [Meristemomyces frigidus]